MKKIIFIHSLLFSISLFAAAHIEQEKSAATSDSKQLCEVCEKEKSNSAIAPQYNIQILNKSLINAIAYNKLAEIQKLISQGADVNAVRVNMISEHEQTPLGTAIRFNNTEAAKLLIINGADVNSYVDSSPALLSTIFHGGNLNIVNLLLCAGADFSKTDRFGNNVIFYARRLCSVRTKRSRQQKKIIGEQIEALIEKEPLARENIVTCWKCLVFGEAIKWPAIKLPDVLLDLIIQYAIHKYDDIPLSQRMLMDRNWYHSLPD